MGAFACLVSAAAFGVMAVFAKLAYAEGVRLDTLLMVRFGLAAVVLLAVAQASGRLRGLGARAVAAGLLMGALGYAAQAGLYFGALTRVDASQVALVFCVYPLLVMVTAVIIGREPPSLGRALALVAALGGVALVLGGRGGAGLDVLGAALALGSGLVYTVYILAGDRLAGVDPLALAALVCAGAFGTFAGWSLTRGGPDLHVSTEAWLWLVLIALVSTVAAIILFFAGLARVGPTAASLLSMVEPVVTVTGAAVVFGESLTARQALGGTLVVGTVLLVQWSAGPTRVARPVSAARRPCC